MRAERWFKVLVLGGAALAKACGGGPGDQGTMKERRPTAGAGATDPNSGGSAALGGSSTSAGHSADPSGASAGGSGSDGGRDGAAGSASTAGGNNASGASAGNSPGGAAGNAGSAGDGNAGGGGADPAGGSAGTGGALECHIRDNGLGNARDPCGCPCCWARDCPNTDAACCVGFCKGADEGRGCCMP